MQPILRSLRLFVFTLALLALLGAGWNAFTTWRIRTYGQEYPAVVVHTWREISTSFTFHRNGRPQRSFVHHAEIALLNTGKIADTEVVASKKEDAPLTADKLATEGPARRQAALARVDSVMEHIRAAGKPAAIPANSPRYTLPNLPDSLAGTLYDGKQVTAKRLNDRVLLKEQYASVWSGKAGGLVMLGLLLLLIGGGVWASERVLRVKG